MIKLFLLLLLPSICLAEMSKDVPFAQMSPTQLLQAMGDDEFSHRQAASREYKARLIDNEKDVLPLLQKNAHHSDAEIQMRVAVLLRFVESVKVRRFLSGDLSGDWDVRPDAEAAYKLTLKREKVPSELASACSSYYSITPVVKNVVVGICVSMDSGSATLAWVTSLEANPFGAVTPIVKIDFKNHAIHVGGQHSGVLQRSVESPVSEESLDLKQEVQK